MKSRLRERLTNAEDLRLTAYDDKTGKPIGPKSIVIGHPTIGYGRCLDTRGITKAEAERMLDEDIAYVEGETSKLPVFVQLDEVRKDILREMIFNIGVEGVLKFKRMLRAMELSYWEVAAAELLDSDYSKQVGHRATELAEAMANGRWAAELKAEQLTSQ